MKHTLLLATLTLCLQSCTTVYSPIASQAKKWENSYFRKGASAQCASWVGQVVKDCGKTPPSGYPKCTSWLGWGKSVSVSLIREGDIVIYAKSNGYNHAAIYIGDGKVIHRPTRSAPVRTMGLHYRRILSVRRG
jgi:cell wall-associated NlpC family hydrolase